MTLHPATTKLTRSKAIHEFCRECAGETHQDLAECEYLLCSLYRFRRGREQKDVPGRRYTRARAIRQLCVDCMGGQAYLVPRCTCPQCWLFGFRNWGTVHQSST